MAYHEGPAETSSHTSLFGRLLIFSFLHLTTKISLNMLHEPAV